ncbi:hypothetical protein [Aquisphaera insulae]|uniref:hypothetical protein n=1 Tax=Aquisphaera insulae TaxID=2712864 RepID=UPI00202DBDC5|nr:hypothetical protein [Aquisphaera insulae]
MLRRWKPSRFTPVRALIMTLAMSLALPACGCSNQDPGQPAIGSISVEDNKGQAAIEKKGSAPRTQAPSKR